MNTTEIIFACGHENIQATHESTLEITREVGLSSKGDCIIAVSANKSVSNLNDEFKENLRSKSSRVTMLIEAGGIIETVTAFGNPQLFLTHPTDIVVRKSSFVCNRTLAIQADKAAYDLSRKLVEKIKNPSQKVKITLVVKV